MFPILLSASRSEAIPDEVTSGRLFTWGSGTDGGLGLGNTTAYNSPKQVGSKTDWHICSHARNALWAVDAAGKLYSCGLNANGQLGHGNTTNISTLAQVGSLTNWLGDMGTADRTAHFVKSDGTMWGIGYSGYGALGINASGDRSSPVQVGSNTVWSTVSGMARSFMALTTTGKIYSWGHAAPDGQTGQGDITNDSSPTQIGSLTSWTSMSQAGAGGSAISAGRLFCWGRNDLGFCCDGSTTDRCSPVQVGSLTDWSKVFGSYQHWHAVKTDGTLWAGGYNQAGRLGLGDTTNRSSPVQVGSNTTWNGVGLQLRSQSGWVDGFNKLWMWGLGSNGATGHGNTTTYSSPVQVGSEKTWARGIKGGDGGWFQACRIKSSA